LLETKKRGFHIIDIHGDWHDSWSFLPFLIRHSDFILLQFGSSDFAADGTLKRSAEMRKLLSFKPKSSKVLSVVRDAKKSNGWKQMVLKANSGILSGLYVIDNCSAENSATTKDIIDGFKESLVVEFQLNKRK